MTVQVFDQLRQFSGILAAVVDASYQTVFKCDPSASLFKIIPAGIQHIFQIKFIGHRHQRLALLLAGRMKG